jgi:Major Facilitator Superfamily
MRAHVCAGLPCNLILTRRRVGSSQRSCATATRRAEAEGGSAQSRSRSSIAVLLPHGVSKSRWTSANSPAVSGDLKTQDRARRLVRRFILLVGVTNLFADMTYEGARGVTGDFLGKLGASGAIVGFVAGGGELAGYVVRSVSGMMADRTGRYWIDVWAGYIINMLCVPALALAGSWPVAAGLMIGERVGRGIRCPAMSAIRSRAGRDLGSGRVFGINEALDQIAGAIGPLIVAFVLARTHNFRLGFAILLILALLTMSVLAAATLASRGLAVKIERKATKSAAKFSRPFWIYSAGGALFAAGCADFALIAHHLGKPTSLLPPSSQSAIRWLWCYRRSVLLCSVAYWIAPECSR